METMIHEKEEEKSTETKKKNEKIENNSISGDNEDEEDEDSKYICEKWITDMEALSLKLPKPTLPSADTYAPVEKFVAECVACRHEKPPSLSKSDDAQEHQQQQKRYEKNGTAYRSILDLLRKRDNPDLLHKVLLALQTSGNGNTLRFISSFPKIHANLSHLIFRLQPFVLPESLVKEENKKLMEFVQKLKNEEAAQSTDPTQLQQKIDSFQTNFRRRAIPFENYSIANAHLNLMLALVSANSVFLTACMSALWRMVILSKEDLAHKWWETKIMTPEQRDKQTKVRIQMSHAALATLLRLCPKGNSDIFPLLASNFPFKTHLAERQIFVAKQCLTVLRYVPTIHSQIIQLLIDKALEMDVEIIINESGKVTLEEDNEDEFGNPKNSNENDMMESNTSIANSPKRKKVVQIVDETKIDEFAEKLDLLMLLIFQHLQSSSKKLPKKGARYLYNMIAPIFDSVILTTHRSKYVQFVLFHLCAIDYEQCNNFQNIMNVASLNAKNNNNSNNDTNNNNNNVVVADDGDYGHDNYCDDDDDDDYQQPTLYREFSAKLIDIIMDPYRATITRQIGACYLASFVSRASFVNAETVCESIAALLRFTEAYMEHYPSKLTTARGNSKREQCEMHSLFYTVSQAAFYIMCFRGKEAISYYRESVAYHQQNSNVVLSSDDDDDDLDIPFADPENINISNEIWNKLCSHHLQPLKYCLESVQGEFLLFADTFSIMDTSLLERLLVESQRMESKKAPKTTPKKRKASSIRTAATLAKARMNGGVGGMGQGKNPLDSFFPFDPYLLRLSYMFVKPYYKNWEGSAELDDTDEAEAIMMEEEENQNRILNFEDDDDLSEADTYDFDDDDEDDSVMKELPVSQQNNFQDMDDEKMNGSDQNDQEMPESHHEVLIQELRRVRAFSIGDECW